MLQSLPAPATAANPQRISSVERDRLADDIRTCLLSVPPNGDPKIRDRKKDLQKHFNKAPDTLAQFLVHAFNEKRPISQRLTTAIGDFFSSRSQRIQRRLRDLNPIETKEEGDVNNIQMAIAQGDESTPTLIRFVTEIDEYVAVLQEMRAAAVAELQKERK